MCSAGQSACKFRYNKIMNGKYQAGETVFIVAAGNRVIEASVLRYTGGFYTLRLPEGGGLRLKEHRLFATREEAQEFALGRTQGIRIR